MTMVSNIRGIVDGALRKAFPDVALEGAFFSRIRRFAHLGDWAGDGRLQIIGEPTVYRRGRGYAICAFDADLLFAMESHGDHTGIARLVIERVEEGAARLGEEVQRRLNNEGSDRAWLDAANQARAEGIGIAVDGVRPIPLAGFGRDWYFHRLGELPHFVVDDGLLSMRDEKSDQLNVYVRLFGNAVPVPKLSAVQATASLDTPVHRRWR